MGPRLILAAFLFAACAPATCGTTATRTATPTATPTALASPSPSPSPAAAIGDACLVGRWVNQKESAPGNWTWNGETIAVTGLQGLVITFSAGGAETDDWSVSQPLIGDYHGHEIKIVLRGSYTFQDHADGSRIVQASAAGTLTATYYYDGVLQPGGTAGAGAGTIPYRCAGDSLHLESPASNPALGPQVDDLIRS